MGSAVVAEERELGRAPNERESAPPARAEPPLWRSMVPPDHPAFAELVRRRPLRVVYDITLAWVVLLSALVLLATVPATWAKILAFVTIGNRLYCLTILSHDGGHKMLFRRRWLNDFVTEYLLCAPSGVDFVGERVNHGTHHRLLGHETDPDRYLHTATDKSTRLELFLFLTGLSVLPRSLKKAFRKAHGASRDQRPLPPFLVRRRATILVQLALWGGMSVFMPWWYYLVFWVGPIYFMAYLPHMMQGFTTHSQPILPDARADGRRIISFRPGPIERFVLSPLNVNYHGEHHVFPFVPYYNLHKLAELTRGRPEIEVRRGYVAYLVRYARALPLARNAVDDTVACERMDVVDSEA